jgi:uncharacterized protein YkwD
MPRVWLSVVFVALTTLAAAQDKKESPAKEQKDESKITREEQEVVDLTNAERKKADLKPLSVNPKLMAAARGHAENMARQEKMEHTLDDKTPADRAKAAGYKYAWLGENIAWNQETPKQVVEGWMNSEHHKENILKDEATEIGVAVAKSKKGERYWVQVFGKPLK